MIISRQYDRALHTAVLIYARGEVEPVREALMQAALVSEGCATHVMVFEEAGTAATKAYEAELRCVDGEWAWWVKWQFKSPLGRMN